jgi:hypothetical protein
VRFVDEQTKRVQADRKWSACSISLFGRAGDLFRPVSAALLVLLGLALLSATIQSRLGVALAV